MADIFDTSKRSEIMGKIKSKGNKSTELKLIRFFKENNIKGWRRNYKIKGHPDFCLSQKESRYFCRRLLLARARLQKYMPQKNEAFWNKKISKNMQRDEFITKYLNQLGWKVIRIWECELNKYQELNLQKLIYII